MINDTPTVHIALMMIDLHIPSAQSLKSKRGVIKSLKERIKSKFNVSVAEVGEMDKWQRSVLAISMVSNDQQYLDSSTNMVLSLIDNFSRVQVIDSHREFL
jgi:uncharacterized protein